MGNELYIGAPNGVVVCIDGIGREGPKGCFWTAYRKDPVPFETLGEMLFNMENFFDSLNFPRRGNRERYFTENRRPADEETGKEKIMSDRELLEHRGKQETFIVRVQHRQNNTWQGRITWADQNKTLHFRSIWEMVHLMENALYHDIPNEEIPEIRSGNDED